MAHLPEARWIAELRLFLPPVLAVGSAWFVDRLCAARGLLPPGFLRPWRRGLAFLALALFFWIALYGNLANLGREAPPLDLTHMNPARLFLVHFMMIGTLLAWFLAGYAGRAGTAPPPRPASPLPLPPDPYELVEHPESLAALDSPEVFPAPPPPSIP